MFKKEGPFPMNLNSRRTYLGVVFVALVILLLVPAAVGAVQSLDAPPMPEQWPLAPHLVQDINTSTAPSNPTELTQRYFLPVITKNVIPTPIMHLVDVNPSIAMPGDLINVTSGNWTPGISVSVSLVEAGQPYTQAYAVPGTTVTTPANPAQGFTIQFVFPDDPRWQIPSDVWVYIHNASWTEWGRDTLELIEQ